MLNLDNIFKYEITRIDSSEFIDVSVEFPSINSKYSDILTKVELKLILTSDKNYTISNIQKINNGNFEIFKSRNMNISNIYDNHHEITVNLSEIFNDKYVKIDKVYIYKKIFRFELKNKDNLYLFSSLNFVNSNNKAENKLFSEYKPNIKFEKLKEDNKVNSKKIFDAEQLKNLIESIISFDYYKTPQKFETKIISEFNEDYKNSEYFIYFIINFEQLFRNDQFGNLLNLPYFKTKINEEINKLNYRIENNSIIQQFNAYDLGNLKHCLMLRVDKNSKLDINVSIKNIFMTLLTDLKNEVNTNLYNIDKIIDYSNDPGLYNSFFDLYMDKFYSEENKAYILNICNLFIKLSDVFNINTFDKNSILCLLNNKLLGLSIVSNIQQLLQSLFYHLELKLYNSDNILLNNESYFCDHNENYNIKVLNNIDYNLDSFKSVYADNISNYSNTVQYDKYYFSPNHIIFNGFDLNIFKDDESRIEFLFVTLIENIKLNKNSKTYFDKLNNIINSFGYFINYDEIILETVNTINISNVTDINKKLIDKTNNEILLNELYKLFMLLFYDIKNFKKVTYTQESPQQCQLDNNLSINIMNYLKYKIIYKVEYYNIDFKTWNKLENINDIKNNTLCRLIRYYNDDLNLKYNENEYFQPMNRVFILNASYSTQQYKVNTITIDKNKIVPTFKDQNTDKLISKNITQRR